MMARRTFEWWKFAHKKSGRFRANKTTRPRNQVIPVSRFITMRDASDDVKDGLCGVDNLPDKTSYAVLEEEDNAESDVEDVGELPITSAEEILRQTQRTINSDYVLYSIYDTPRCGIEQLRRSILDFTLELSKNHVYNREPFHINLVHKNENSFLQGIVFYGESGEDEWYIVHLLWEISRHFPSVAIHVEDNDGEFLLIEASEEIPAWIRPENARNRVWLRDGHIVILNSTSSVLPLEVEELPLQSALQTVLHDSYSRFIDAKVTKCISARLEDGVGKLYHKSVCYVPRSCAVALRMYPDLVAKAVESLCSLDASERKALSAMCCFGAKDFVSTEVVFTRAQYAQLMFLQFFAPPALRRLQTSLAFEDPDHLKALDVGFRITCGLEAAFKRCVELGMNNKVVGDPCDVLQSGEFPMHQPQIDGRYDVSTSRDANDESDLLAITREVEFRILYDVHAKIANALDVSKRGQEDFLLVTPTMAAIGGKSDSDDWLSVTQDELDRTLKETARQSGDGALDEIAGSIERFVSKVSGLEGADTDGVRPTEPRAEGGKDLFSDDDDSSTADDMGNKNAGESDADSLSSEASGSRRLDEADGDVVIDLDKLVGILERISLATSTSASSNRGQPEASEERISAKEVENKKSERLKHARSNSSIPKRHGNESSSAPNFVSSMGTGSFLLNDSNDSDEIQSKSDSDDEDDERDNFGASYAVALERELAASKMSESFIKREASGQDVTESDALSEAASEVDTRLNLLTHLLESHASQGGAPGPASNLLGLLGLRLDEAARLADTLSNEQ